MFADESLDVVEIKSCWKKERSLTDSSCQTKPFPTEEVACQSMKRKHREVQTEEQKFKEFEYQEDESPELVEFLRDIEPYVIKQLMKNRRSHAFDGFDTNWEEENVTVTNLHTLTYPELNEELQVTGLAWNSTGSVVVARLIVIHSAFDIINAVIFGLVWIVTFYRGLLAGITRDIYGAYDHEDWCTHKSALCTWNLDRKNMNANKPDTVIDLSSCLMCIACHPKKPSIVAGGTFDGEVIVWDTSKEEEPRISSSGIGNDSHREPVSKVHWMLDESKGKKYNVVSISSDGKILVWRMSSSKPVLKLIEGFILLTENLPRSLRSRSGRGDKEVGVTSISTSKEDASTFLIGSDCGGIFKCSRNVKGAPASSESHCSVELRSPVNFTYNPHEGPVYGVDASPYHRNVFLSAGTDSTARIYSMLLKQPIITIEPASGYLYAAKWSPVRPLVFAISCENGNLLIYDLHCSKAVPVHKLEASPKKKPIYSMQFNPYEHQLLATGDGAGYIQIWKLSDELTHQGNKEIEMLDDIAKSVME